MCTANLEWPLNSARQLLQRYLTDKTPPMLELTQATAVLNSGSTNPDGVAAVARQFIAAFTPWSDSHYVRRLSDTGNIYPHAHQFDINPQALKRVLLVGHLDTVFAPDGGFDRCWREGDCLRGPGVADMKGGIVVMLMALQALRETNLLGDLGITVVLTPDEEIGSPYSRKLLNELAPNYMCGLVFEPALEDGTLAGARKGSGNFKVLVSGRSVHAGREFFNGINAVAGAAQLAAELAGLSNAKQGTSVNIAQIEGGAAINVVPDSAIIHFNVRVNNSEALAVIQLQLKQVIAKYNAQQACEFSLQGEFHRPPKNIDTAHQALFDLLTSCGDALQQPVQFRATGGCCDGNNLAAAGLPNIDTMGVCGGGIHSEREFLLIESFTARAALTALFLSQLNSLTETS